MTVTENEFVTYKAYMQYISKLLCAFITLLLALRQHRNMCATYQLTS